MTTIEKISQKSFFATGVILALAFSLLLNCAPHNASADMTTHPNDDANSIVSLLVNPSLTLEVAIDPESVDPNPAAGETNSMFIQLTPNGASSGRFLARVSTNRDYILQLNGLDGDTTMSHDTDATSFIPGTGCTVAAGTSCWGVVSWSDDYNNPPDTTYKSIPAIATEFARGTGPVSEEETRFEVGISAGSDLVAGDYKGKLVVTASNI